MRMGDVDVPWQLSTPAPDGFGTHGHRSYPATETVGYTIGKCSTRCTWRKSARNSVVVVMVDGGPAGFAGFFGLGAFTANLPPNPLPSTTATRARGPIALWTDAGIAAAVAPAPRICARSLATAADPGR